MTYPILEHDSTREAFIEPSKVIRPRDIPEHCVISFFMDVIVKVAAEHQAKVVVDNSWEDESDPVYEIVFRAQRLTFFHTAVTFGLADVILEEVIAYDCLKIITCRRHGALQPDIAVRNLIVVSGAIRDVGVSYHYWPRDPEV